MVCISLYMENCKRIMHYARFLVAWSIWKHRCRCVFAGTNPLQSIILSYGRLSLSTYLDTPHTPTTLSQQLTVGTCLLQPATRLTDAAPVLARYHPRPPAFPPSPLSNLHCDPTLPSDPAPAPPPETRTTAVTAATTM